jgi:hypothetical protein
MGVVFSLLPFVISFFTNLTFYYDKFLEDDVSSKKDASRSKKDEVNPKLPKVGFFENPKISQKIISTHFSI